ncbi:pseudouridine synthase [Sediminitomix flava]|uniref:Pseudouridine synthase n=1 Tax=Sediminitomix flava TaxID=379075 RepID=A0A315Z6S4_SEDFL|nr:pseudouridine synthase [Sediminitomix flava]PWJ40128.1 23S rRNA pseudouridine2605 synthase [Sediminitomix flava]
MRKKRIVAGKNNSLIPTNTPKNKKEALRRQKQEKSRERRINDRKASRQKHVDDKNLMRPHSPADEKKQNSPDYDFKKIREIQKKKNQEQNKETSAEIRLNKYISNSGVCSRREADVLIQNGEITVNGKVVTELGYKVKPNDTVKHQNKVLKKEKLTYVLLNKPKGFITTTKDPKERKTVMSLVKNAGESRIYPVGRLDRNTTGLLLFTNDGELAKQLAHPSGNTQKVYYVTLNKPLKDEDHEKIIHRQFVLEDGAVDIDGFSILTPDKKEIGIELHSGRNRIVRRIFEHFGYVVEKLDRTAFAGLTKKDLPRGNWRFLNEQEIVNLKFFKRKI